MAKSSGLPSTLPFLSTQSTPVAVRNSQNLRSRLSTICATSSTYVLQDSSIGSSTRRQWVSLYDNPFNCYTNLSSAWQFGGMSAPNNGLVLSAETASLTMITIELNTSAAGATSRQSNIVTSRQHWHRSPTNIKIKLRLNTPLHDHSMWASSPSLTLIVRSIHRMQRYGLTSICATVG